MLKQMLNIKQILKSSRIYGKNYDLSKYTTKDYSPIRIPEYVSYKGIRYWVTRIADYAFNGRRIDREIDIPETVKSIGDWAFRGTPWLDNHPDDFVVVGNGILIRYKGKQSDVVIPDSVTSIGDGAFVCDGGAFADRYQRLCPRT